MESIPSWEVNISSHSQEISLNLLNKIYHCTFQRTLPLTPVYSQANPVYAFLLSFLNFHFNVIWPSTPKFSKLSLYLFFVNKPVNE
jgi:hypothetical protein